MSSETSMVAADFRLQEWAAQIRECQNRPAGMSVVGWCACHGITKANYYYRLRRVGKSVLKPSRRKYLYSRWFLYSPGFCSSRNRKVVIFSQDWIFP